VGHVVLDHLVRDPLRELYTELLDPSERERQLQVAALLRGIKPYLTAPLINPLSTEVSNTFSV
jgi:hypothetical protein